MQVKIVKAGLLTTLQDQGRLGYRNLGIPVAGAMDTLASQIANLLAGNTKKEAVLELTYGDVEMIAETDILISCCGGGTRFFVNDNELPLWKTIFIPAGSQIKFDNDKDGCRTYIAIAGGWQAQNVLNSNSTYLPIKIGGLDGGALKRGTLIKSNKDLSKTSQSIFNALESSGINFPKWGVYINDFINYLSRKIRVLLNHEYDWFDSDSQKSFFTESFSLTMQSNRMGYQLSRIPLNLKKPRQLLSSAVSKGTIQVTGSGSLIMLMADCQTTGGYPRIAQVAAVDLPICAQLKPGDAIQFEKISMEEAEIALLKQRQQLLELERSIESRFNKS